MASSALRGVLWPLLLLVDGGRLLLTTADGRMFLGIAEGDTGIEGNVNESRSNMESRPCTTDTADGRSGASMASEYVLTCSSLQGMWEAPAGSEGNVSSRLGMTLGS